ncbi:MAG: hypothetical protein U9N77_13670 [Thermodesulfobacteriota bacterium]|nr:hypothetical protein [Thermodesulfobacteriota bacterium]
MSNIILKKIKIRIALLLCAWMLLSAPTTQAFVAPAVKISAKHLDAALELAAKVSGKVLTPATRKAALTQLRNAVVKHGEEAILVARKGGLELITAAEKYGDDVWKFASRAPEGARALAMHPRELLPLTRRIGTEVLQIEAKAPGLAKQVVRNFGDDGVRYFGKHVPAGDATRLVGYAKKADSQAARQMLLEIYQKRGTHFLDKLSWKHIMAGGLSASMITAAYQISDGVQEGLTTVAENSPETFNKTVSHTIDRITQPFIIPATFFGIGLAAIWLFRYYRRAKKKVDHS